MSSVLSVELMQINVIDLVVKLVNTTDRRAAAYDVNALFSTRLLSLSIRFTLSFFYHADLSSSGLDSINRIYSRFRSNVQQGVARS